MYADARGPFTRCIAVADGIHGLVPDAYLINNAMSRTTRFYAAILLTPLAASLMSLALCPAPVPGSEAVAAPLVPAVPVPAPVVTPVDLLGLPDCDDEPVAAAEPPAPTRPAHDPGAAVLLHGRHLVLATLPDMTWSAGQPKIRGLSDGFTVDYALARDVVPADIQSQADARFTVFASDGGTCQADAGPLAIHGRMEGVFLFDEAAPTRAELHETATSMEPDAHVVQAALRGPRGCTGVWARRADLPAPIVFGRGSVDADERAQVLGLLDAQPAVAALRSERAEYYADMPAEDAAAAAAGWSTFLGDTLELTAWDEIGGARRYITAQVGSEDEGCGGFGERAAVLFLRDGAALVAQPGPGFLDPLAVMDIDRDGQLEAVTEHGHTLESRDEHSPLVRHYGFPDLGCGC